MQPVILPRRVVRQPKPNLNPGGDCGACVLAGVLQLEGPQGVYDQFMDGKPQSLGWHEQADLLGKLYWNGVLDRVITDVPHWPNEAPPFLQAFGISAVQQSMAWFRYMRMAFDAGYYGVLPWDYSGSGPLGHGTDHVVLACGVREESVALDNGVGRIEQQILISCSAAHPEGKWYSKLDILKRHGGFNAILVRPVSSE